MCGALWARRSLPPPAERLPLCNPSPSDEVLEHDSRLASSQFRTARYARISRRCAFAAAAAGGQGGEAPLEQQQAPAPADALPAASGTEHCKSEEAAAAEAAASASPLADSENALTTACSNETAAAASPACAAAVDDPLNCCFAVAGDAELSDGEEAAGGPAAAQARERQQAALGRVASRLLRLDGKLSSLAARAQRQPFAAASASSPQPPLPATGAGWQSATADPAPARPAAVTGEAAVPSPRPALLEPVPALACPQPNSSLLLERRKRLLELQVRWLALAGSGLPAELDVTEVGMDAVLTSSRATYPKPRPLSYGAGSQSSGGAACRGAAACGAAAGCHRRHDAAARHTPVRSPAAATARCLPGQPKQGSSAGGRAQAAGPAVG